ncbi:MAG: MFS transporter [Bacteroidales bacterium]|jgi:MFS family permease|nr:MFS transporter [Bacteroidales bacterium]
MSPLKTTGLPATRERLFTANFYYMCAANFLLSFAFYLLIPTLPFYLIETMQMSKTMVGVSLSCYTLAVLLVRPFSGFIADTFARKPLYLLSCILFTFALIGYLPATTILLFIILRFFHGMSFGILTTTGNTLVIDIMPSARRGEGLGYFGITGNLAMATGPMVGLFLHAHLDFYWIFVSAIVAGIAGTVFAALVKTTARATIKKQPLSLDRFVLLKGLPAGFAFLLLAIPYSMTTSYMALSVANLPFHGNSGLFFTVMSLGLILSRLSSGKQVDRGFVTQTIRKGIFIGVVGFVGEIFLYNLIQVSPVAGAVLFYAIAACIGYGFGTLFPAWNTLFINLAPNDRRATANSTYLTGWDVGVGIGIYLGGHLAEVKSFSFAFAVGTAFALSALIFFLCYVTPHFQKNKLR